VASETSGPAVGDRVDGRYELLRVIGAGGMGEVWEARDHQLETPCAVKFILDHIARDKTVRGRFAREAKAVAALRTAHTAQVFGLGEHKGAPYIAMELLEGETLRGRLTRLGSLDPKTSLAIVEQIGHTLERARSAQIVHRDLKPENIWLSAERDVFVKVLDFGVAKSQLTTTSLQTVTGALLGTPYYMSPEQAMGKTTLDYRSDLWALAIIAMECLSGKRPFESESLSELLINIVTTTPPPVQHLAPQLPSSLQSFWERGLAREPDARFQSAAELVEAFRKSLFDPSPAPQIEVKRVVVAGSAPGTAGTVSPLSSTRFAARGASSRWQWLAAGLGAVVAISLAILGVRLLSGDGEPRPETRVAPPGSTATNETSATAAPAATAAAGEAPPPATKAESDAPVAHEPAVSVVAPEGSGTPAPAEERAAPTEETRPETEKTEAARPETAKPETPKPAAVPERSSGLGKDIAALTGGAARPVEPRTERAPARSTPAPARPNETPAQQKPPPKAPPAKDDIGF
jgi:hypothetical protein